MADEELRELERAWRAAPEDGERATRWVEALRRAGRPAPRAARDARVLPPRTIRTSVPIEVRARLGEASLPGGSTEGGRAVELPAHSGWTAELRGGLGAAELARLADELVALQVERVSLSRPLALADEAPLVGFFERLRGAPLQGLSAPHDWPLSAALLGAVVDQPGLRELTGSVDEGVDALGRAIALEEVLLLVGERVTDAHLARLGAARELAKVALVSAIGSAPSALTGSFVGALAPSVRALGLHACARAGDATLEQVARLPALTSLRLPTDLEGLTDAGLERLAGLGLEELAVGGPALGDRALGALSGLALRSLELRAPRATPAGWTRLPASLERLELTHEGPDAATCLRSALGAVRRLRSLELASRGFLADPPRADLTALSAVPELAELQLGDVPVEPAALRDLARLPALRSIRLSGMRWGDRHVAALAGLPTLEALSLFVCSSVTDGALTPLVGCRSLRRLELAPIGMTEGPVARFRRARPDVAVEVLGGLEPDRPGLLARFLGLFRAS